MKRAILLGLSILVFIFSTILVKTTVQEHTVAHGKVSYAANDVKTLARDSEVILVGTVTSDKESTILHDVEFTISKVNIEYFLKNMKVLLQKMHI